MSVDVDVRLTHEDSSTYQTELCVIGVKCLHDEVVSLYFSLYFIVQVLCARPNSILLISCRCTTRQHAGEAWLECVFDVGMCHSRKLTMHCSRSREVLQSTRLLLMFGLRPFTHIYRRIRLQGLPDDVLQLPFVEKGSGFGGDKA